MSDCDSAQLTVPLADGGCRLVVVHGEVTRSVVARRWHSHGVHTEGVS